MYPIIHDTCIHASLDLPESTKTPHPNYAGLTIVTDRPTDRWTDRPRYSVCMRCDLIVITKGSCNDRDYNSDGSDTNEQVVKEI